MLGFKGSAQPSPSLGDALNAGYLYLEVRCLGRDTHQTVAPSSAFVNMMHEAWLIRQCNPYAVLARRTVGLRTRRHGLAAPEVLRLGPSLLLRFSRP
jgi:hypothetical protein